MDKSAVRILLIVMVVSFAIAAMTYQNGGGWTAGAWSVDQMETIPTEGIDQIEAISSSIRIRVQRGTEAAVTAHLVGDGRALGAAEPELRVRTNGNRLRLEVVQPSGLQWFFSGSPRLEVTIPPEYTGSLQVKTSSGRIETENLSGLSEISLTASSGRIDGSDLQAERITLTSSSGSIDLRNVQADRAQVTASSGSITVRDPQIAQRLQLKASSGRISLTMPRGSDFSLTARASSGRITDNVGLQATTTANNYLEGNRGSGGPVVHIETSSGSIQVD